MQRPLSQVVSVGFEQGFAVMRSILLGSFMGITCDTCGHFTDSPSFDIHDHGRVVCPGCSIEQGRWDHLEDMERRSWDMSDDIDIGTCQICGSYFNYYGGNELCSMCIRL